jgi:hypothetical protein
MVSSISSCSLEERCAHPASIAPTPERYLSFLRYEASSVRKRTHDSLHNKLFDSEKEPSRFTEWLLGDTGGIYRLLALLVGVVAVFLPWEGAFAKENGATMITSSINLLEIVGSQDMALVLGGALFITGLFLAVIRPGFAFLLFISLIIIISVGFSFVQSGLPPWPPPGADPTSSFSIDASIAAGYLVAWLAAFMFLVIFARERLEDFARWSERSGKSTEHIDLSAWARHR